MVLRGQRPRVAQRPLRAGMAPAAEAAEAHAGVNPVVEVEGSAEVEAGPAAPPAEAPPIPAAAGYGNS